MTWRQFARCTYLCALLVLPLAARADGGIGKFHKGREIAALMRAQDAAWLEREGRQRRERPDVLLLELRLEPTRVVADIGAGRGYLTLSLASAVPSGTVYAVEIQPPLVMSLQALSKQPGMAHIVPVLGAVDDIRLPPESLDLVLMVDTYHELEFPDEVMESVLRALKPSGRLVLVEYRAENQRLPIGRLHKMSEAQLRRELAAHALVLERASQSLPLQHLLVFRKL